MQNMIKPEIPNSVSAESPVLSIFSANNYAAPQETIVYFISTKASYGFKVITALL